ncbi:MAG: adenosine kinase [Acidobacteria bacterium]|nr:adenosine kinase [Acidobacteriota bacterium]
MTSLPPPVGRSLDVVCIGMAIVDVLTHTDDAFLDHHAMVKGAMDLIDTERALRIYDAMPPAIEISGGSAANTAVGVASFGRRAAFIGKVADDDLGAVFAHDIRAAGVAYATDAVTGAAAAAGTARCLILVTPDAQRTMNTHLGVAASLQASDVDADLIASASVLYIEGYLWDDPGAIGVIRTAIDTARAAGTRVAFSLSDGFCVDRHRQEFLRLVAADVDILFANEVEICSLYETSEFASAAAQVSDHVAIACLTRSEQGSVVVAGGERIVVPAVPAELVDTTGAGDLYAAGFLSGWSSGLSIEDAARMGSLAAGEVISHLGARPQSPLSDLWRVHR